MMRVLVSWVGTTDLLSMAGQASAEVRKRVLEVCVRDKVLDGRGPVRTLVESVEFDEIHLLCNYPKGLGKDFVRWLGRKASLHEIQLKSPTDYQEVFSATDQVLSSLKSKHKDLRLSIHLSPGTPTMTAIWVLLGKSRYPATFYQTWGDKFHETNIPFDLVVDFVPELIRDADNALQQLAARSPQEIHGFGKVIGESKAIRLAVGRAAKAAVRDVSILIQGESGTGKEVFARAIHDGSPRAAKPFVAINCAAIPRELLESELFGHKKGAFTGAVNDHIGAFEQADTGTLFLDEIGECPADLQAKLLRALQPPDHHASLRIFRRVGESKERQCDVRIVAATNRDLFQRIAENQFREDLYYRLAVISVNLPALRERATDIPLLAQHLLSRINAEFRKQEPGYKDKSLGKDAIAFMRKHNWPGNVRQLYNSLTQAAVMTDREVLRTSDLSSAIADSRVANQTAADLPLKDGFSIGEHLDSIHRRYIERALEETDGVKSRARKLLGIASDQTFAAQLKRLGIE